MPLINVTNRAGDCRSIQAEPGQSLMELLREEGYEEILAICGGSCSCATCHVHIETPANQTLPVIEEDEQMLLELADEFDPERSRLSCQIEVSDALEGIEVTLIDVD